MWRRAPFLNLGGGKTEIGVTSRYESGAFGTSCIGQVGRATGSSLGERSLSKGRVRPLHIRIKASGAAMGEGMEGQQKVEMTELQLLIRE